MESFIARCIICKSKFFILGMGTCSDLKYEKYLQNSGASRKCKNNDWELLEQIGRNNSILFNYVRKLEYRDQIYKLF